MSQKFIQVLFFKKFNKFLSMNFQFLKIIFLKPEGDYVMITRFDGIDVFLFFKIL